ncbi:MAG: hypothetical protein JJT88_20670 [Gammaproteobacteria bacterium]|nr:hypothetical protein [Gammaproteobacteria bacterium]
MTATPSEPRPGLPGLLDRYLGPDATASDGLRVAVAGLGGLLLGLLTVPAPLAERVLLALLTAELCAGLMAALNHAGKAWIHRPTRRLPRLLLFVALQTIPLTLFIWLFRGQDLALLASTVALLFAGSAAVMLAPAAWQRAVGLVALLGVLFALQHFHTQAPAGAWFLPLAYARTFLAHLPAPRPD